MFKTLFKIRVELVCLKSGVHMTTSTSSYSRHKPSSSTDSSSHLTEKPVFSLVEPRLYPRFTMTSSTDAQQGIFETPHIFDKYDISMDFNLLRVGCEGLTIDQFRTFTQKEFMDLFPQRALAYLLWNEIKVKASS